jgi:hypothetical protein
MPRSEAHISLTELACLDLHVTYTLAASSSGLPQGQLAQVQALKKAGVILDVLSLMTMDMGVSNVLSASEQAATAGGKQFEKTFGVQAGEGIKHIGLIPMPGKDDQGTQFSVAQAKQRASSFVVG